MLNVPSLSLVFSQAFSQVFFFVFCKCSSNVAKMKLSEPPVCISTIIEAINNKVKGVLQHNCGQELCHWLTNNLLPSLACMPLFTLLAAWEAKLNFRLAQFWFELGGTLVNRWALISWVT